ncbi:hypothetical protein HK098_000245 [Nowakowskiella sp. JEL0407]|nr:hypothetical protein HK098_000239 [Nowakowskiella sp. JEL0407]KAJ3125492.1 hypothetical protein HK098_000245 [Nowakowskiella sp. JEL0407]
MSDSKTLPQIPSDANLAPPLPPYEPYNGVPHPSAFPVFEAPTTPAQPPSSSTYPSETTINCKMSSIDRSYGANTANPIIPQRYVINANMGTVNLHLLSIPGIMNIDIDIESKMSTIVIKIPKGLEVINEMEANFSTIADQRSNRKVDGNHSTIRVSGRAKFSTVVISDH